MRVEVYLRPKESPFMYPEDKDIRINYNDTWIDFKNGGISDGYHTFDELYEHRMLLFVMLMNAYPEISWRSWLHNDGTMFDGGWFIAGMNLPKSDVITYHLKDIYWDMISPLVEELDCAPKWDGHTSKDVIDRFKAWIKNE